MRSPDSRPATPADESGQRAGLVVCPASGSPFFVSAREVRSVVVPEAALPLGRAAGVGIGVALVDGRLASSVDLSGSAAGAAPTGPALLAWPEGRAEPVLVLGLEVLATGTFGLGLDPSTVLHRGRSLPIVDLGDRIREIEIAAFRAVGPAGLANHRKTEA